MPATTLDANQSTLGQLRDVEIGAAERADADRIGDRRVGRRRQAVVGGVNQHLEYDRAPRREASSSHVSLRKSP